MWRKLKAWFEEDGRVLWETFLDFAWQAAFNALRFVIMGFALGLGYLLAFGIAANFFCSKAHAAEVTIPRAAVQHRAELVRSARVVWGLEAPVAVFAAQIHTESWWRNDTVSHVGAQGLAQFMPATAAWLPKVAPETGQPAPFNPGWSLRALCAYDKWLWDRTDGATDFERMAFTLSAYNGGQGWVNRDKKLARQRGLNPARWFDNVETVNAGRSAAAWKENRGYPRRILRERQQAYVRAGWGPGIEDVTGLLPGTDARGMGGKAPRPQKDGG